MIQILWIRCGYGSLGYTEITVFLAICPLEIARKLSFRVPRKAVYGNMSHQIQLERHAGVSCWPVGPSGCHALEKLYVLQLYDAEEAAYSKGVGH